jgi:hypothetical protein
MRGETMPGNGSLVWEPEYQQALKRARDERKELLVYFSKPN